MVNSLFTVFSEKTVSTTKQYNVTESFLRQSFYPYADCDVKPVQPGAGQDGDETPEDVSLHPPRLAVHQALPDGRRVPPEVRLHPRPH